MTANRFPFLAQRMFNRPLIIHPAKAEVIVAALMDRLGIHGINQRGEVLAMDDDDWSGPAGETSEEEGYDLDMGIARIVIEGTTVMKLGTMRPYSGMTGYDGIREAFFTAQADSRVKGIMLDIDSPGGEVAGCFDLVDDMFAMRGNKPVYAILTESAYSAGYALASPADKIFVPRTGGLGSIGIVWAHYDFSAAITDAGMKVTFVTRGDRKVDGACEIPLSEAALATAQADIDAIGGIFEETVARNRGLSAKKIRDMQAGTFLGADGVAQGLADEVMAPPEAFRQLLRAIG